MAEEVMNKIEEKVKNNKVMLYMKGRRIFLSAAFQRTRWKF